MELDLPGDLHRFVDKALHVEPSLFVLQRSPLGEVLPLIDCLIRYFRVKFQSLLPCLLYSLPII